jgi:hypothetical protein
VVRSSEIDDNGRSTMLIESLGSIADVSNKLGILDCSKAFE